MEFVVWFNSDLWNLLFDLIQIYVVWLNSDVWNLLFDLIQIYGICCLISFRFMEFVVWFEIEQVWGLCFGRESLYNAHLYVFCV